MIKDRAKNVVDEVKDKVSIDPFTILTIVTTLLQLLASCYKQGLPGAGANAADYVRDHYDAGQDAFDQTILDQVRGQTRKAIRQNYRHGQGKPVKDYTSEEITAVSDASLREVMNNPQDISSCMAEAVQ